MTAYYNEFDPFAAAWLKRLIDKNLIAKGDVDVRSITEVQPDDLKSYTQCHFFAGIGGWSHALRLAGWDDSRPVWTGSCPCQSFSSAGKQKGKDDARHLWPVWFRLIRECRPAIVFGEQVAAAITHEWLDEVATDLESESYAFGSAVLPACSVGAPHKRDRLWFVAKPEMQRYARREDGNEAGQKCPTGSGRQDQGLRIAQPCDIDASDVDHTIDPRPQGQSGYGRPASGRQEPDRPIAETGIFSDVEWHNCPDGKTRPAKSGLPLLAHGVSNRVGKLRGYGNAIVPQVAAEFIKASM